MVKRKSSYFWENLNWSNHYVKQYFKKLKIELPYNSAVILLSIYKKEMKIRFWQNICPTANEWIQSYLYICVHIYTHTHIHIYISSKSSTSPSRVWLFATPWTVDCQAPLSIGFSRQEYWSGPAPSILYLTLNLDWQFVSYMILYMFQCHSPKSSHTLPLPQSPKDFWNFFKF